MYHTVAVPVVQSKGDRKMYEDLHYRIGLLWCVPENHALFPVLVSLVPENMMLG